MTKRSSKPAAIAEPGRPAETEGDELDHVLERANVPGDRVQLWRYNVASGTYVYLEPFDPAGLKPLGIREFTRQRYGGGKFKARVRHPNGQYGITRTYEIDGEPRARETDPAAAVPPAPAAGAVPDWVRAIILPIGATFATAFGTLLAKKLLETREPATDPAMLELIKSLRTAPRDADPVETFARMMTVMKESGGGNNGAEMFKMVKDLLELRDRVLESAPDARSPLESVVRDGIRPALQLMERKMNLDEQRAARIQAGPAAAAATPPAAAPVDVDGDPLALFLAQIPLPARHFLLGCAKGDKDPSLYADLILDQIPEEMYPEIPALLERPDVVDVFCKVVPAFASYRPWFEQLVGALRDAIARDDEESAGGMGVNDELDDPTPPGAEAIAS